jgi:hypothetical protein
VIPVRIRQLAVASIVCGAGATGAAAPPAAAFNPLKPVCAVGGLVSGLVGKACNVVQHSGRLLSAGKKLASGHLGSAVKTVLGPTGSSVGTKATFALGLAAVVGWVLGGAKYALNATAGVIGHTTAPQLRSTWFSATYWRVAGIAALLTLPFLFAAAIQALVRSDLALLVRAAFGYLPLAMLGVGIAAPLTMLLLSASDELSAAVSSAAGHAGVHFLAGAGAAIGTLSVLSRSPFLVFFVGLLTVGAAIVLWFELLLRAAAVYVIVLMLPLAFAALVWPARRIWAIRAVEVLIALILSKFLIVAVLSLGGAALSQSFLTSISGMLAGFVLLMLGALTPWALLRLLPLGDIAGGAAGSLRGESVSAGGRLLKTSAGGGAAAHEWAATTAEMRRDADGFAEAADPASQPPVGEPPAAETLIGGATPASQDAATPSPGDAAIASPQSGATPSPDGAIPRQTSNGSRGTDRGAPPDEPGATVAAPRPGLDPIWEMEDFSWPVLGLGLEHGWPPKPIADAAGLGSEPETRRRDRGGNGSGPGAPAANPDRAEPDHEDHDPRPSPQPREGGSL